MITKTQSKLLELHGLLMKPFSSAPVNVDSVSIDDVSVFTSERRNSALRVSTKINSYVDAIDGTFTELANITSEQLWHWKHAVLNVFRNKKEA